MSVNTSGYDVNRGGKMDDPVEHPAHYTCFGSAEVIDITERLDFCRGSAVKYLCRAGRKGGADGLEDLRKALECTKREIQRVETEHMQIKGAHKAVVL